MSTTTTAPGTLTSRDPVAVHFAGDRGGDAPMTLGQLNIWQWLSVAPEHAYATIGVDIDVPAGTRIADVAEVVSVLLARHESLRTTYVDGDPPIQRVIASGVLRISAWSIHNGPFDRHALSADLTRRLRADESPLPLRVAIAITDDDTVVAAVAAFSHLAVDFMAMEIVRREFTEMIRDRSARHVGPPRHQPIDQAALEASPRVRQRAERALDHWRKLLSRMPSCLYAVPASGTTARSTAVEMSSAAAALALRRIVRRTRTSPASAVLAAVCAVLAHRTGYRELVFPTISNNRFERHLIDYVGTLAQGSLIAVETGGGFDALVRRAWAAALEAGGHGRYDVYQRLVLAERIEQDRGVAFGYEPLFNNAAGETPLTADTGGVVAQPGEIAAARGRTRLRPRSMPASGTLIRFDLYQVSDVLRLELWSGDTSRVPHDELRSLLLAVENVLVAASATDLDETATIEAIGLPRIVRDANWLQVDSCWAELTEVRRLLDDALGPATAHLTVDGGALVAHVARTDAVWTPEQARARCMAVLPGRPTAITPHFVMYDDAAAIPAQTS